MLQSCFIFSIFFVRIVLGNPAKAFYPLIDPTISMTWLYCNGCELCPTKSSLKVYIPTLAYSNISQRLKLLGNRK